MDVWLLDGKIKTLLHLSPAARKALQRGDLDIYVHLSANHPSIHLSSNDAFWAEAKELGLQLRCTLLTDAFEVRKVSFESLHEVMDKDLQVLADSLQLQQNSSVLDMMCGYGAVGASLLAYATQKNIKISLTLCDLHETQMAAMPPALRSQAHSVQIGDARNAPFPDESFDAVANKMGNHDVPHHEQPTTFQEMFRILKPGGVFSIWDVIFDDAEMQDAFNDVIRRKDLLAGYESYLCDRYFFRKDQAERMFREAGFTEVKLIHQVH
ncbi:MAG: methyltransferase domain-containing protein, partial [Verrucomicrobia bacterium]|nr:methyltransferase domain-containing protein [Verrucomicrobiota bacterium]